MHCISYLLVAARLSVSKQATKTLETGHFEQLGVCESAATEDKLCELHFYSLLVKYKVLHCNRLVRTSTLFSFSVIVRKVRDGTVFCHFWLRC